MTHLDGSLHQRRVVTEFGGILETVLEHSLTGYLDISVTESLLSDGGDAVLTVEDGIPKAAFQPATNRGGEELLADISVASLYRVELYEADTTTLTQVHNRDGVSIPPTLPAKQLVGDHDLAGRTRRAVPGDDTDDPGLDAVSSFLDDESTISTIQERARKEARERASEWGFATESKLAGQEQSQQVSGSETRR